MLAGLDVGGTQTDAVLLSADDGRCLASAKAPTRPAHPLPGVLEALAALFAQGGGHDPGKVRRLTVSTTLGLNALLTGQTAPVGLLAVPGPGLDPALFRGEGPLLRILPGAQDHRGRVIAAPPAKAVAEALAVLAENGARALGVVCKFSPKNPALEQSLAKSARAFFGPDMPLVLGSELSGSLNFPRRLNTVWYNAALAAVSREFTDALLKAAAELGLSCPVAVLKADAGSFSAEEAALDPASTMGSGPAASLLGVWALSRREAKKGARGHDFLMIDMGGTSTDLALLASGHPLLSREGLAVDRRPTLIRTLWTRSLALGGDSSLRLRQGLPRIGPDRSGPALSLTGDDPVSRPPTLTDALNALGLADIGNTALSRKALDALALSADCPPSAAGNGKALARLFVDAACLRIRNETGALLAEVNARPVYTIRELLVQKALEPQRAFFIGGPAPALAQELEGALGLPVTAPAESAFANALGAALARPTKAAELYADTLLGRMTVPDLGLEKDIRRSYSLDDARADLLSAFAARAQSGALPAQIVYAENFAVLDDAGKRGRILRARAQAAPGLVLGE